MAHTFLAPLALVFAKEKVTGWIALASCLAMFASYVPVLRLYRMNPLSTVTLPLAAIFYVYATIHSAVNYYRGKGGAWKARAQHVQTSL